jgi:hypothetical protein
MPDTAPDLRPATTEELTQSLAFALRFDGRKRARDADDFMARAAAERLAEHLRISGFVVMKRPALAAHGAGECRPRLQDPEG